MVEILNKLIDKFENSKTYVKTSKIKQNFRINISKIHPRYDDEFEFDYFEDMNYKILDAVNKNFIKISEKTGEKIISVQLNTENVNEIYVFLERTPKIDKNNENITLLNKYKGNYEILDLYINDLLESINSNKNIEIYEDDLIAINEILKLESETYYYNFSARVFNNSKKFSQISNKIAKIFCKYSEYDDEKNVLSFFNLVKTPSYVYFKGKGCVKFNSQKIDLDGLDIAISAKNLDDIEVKVAVSKIITVENLTTFHTLNEKNAFVVYLGGFHNSIRRKFLISLHNLNKNAEFYHFGDIDAGGFYIFNHLVEKTKIPFKPYKMDIETLKKYHKFTKELTIEDRKRLNNLKDSMFFKEVCYMLEKNVKLEQEVIENS
ncbi:MAG: DUF2220 family protein [Clostridia bacterium]